MSRRFLTVATAALALAGIAALTGCSPDEDATESPSPSTTAVGTLNPDEQAGQTEPLAVTAYSFGTYRVYEVVRYTASEGCGCAIEDGGPELYPAGTTAILLRVTYTPQWITGQSGTTWTIPDLQMEATIAGVEGAAVLEEHEGPERAKDAGVAWLPDGLFPDGQGTVTNDVPVSWSAAYYVPKGAQKITLTLTGNYDPNETGLAAKPTEIAVPIATVQR